jgi:hypothetical protein
MPLYRSLCSERISSIDTTADTDSSGCAISAATDGGGSGDDDVFVVDSSALCNGAIGAPGVAVSLGTIVSWEAAVAAGADADRGDSGAVDT